MDRLTEQEFAALLVVFVFGAIAAPSRSWTVNVVEFPLPLLFIIIYIDWQWKTRRKKTLDIERRERLS